MPAESAPDSATVSHSALAAARFRTIVIESGYTMPALAVAMGVGLVTLRAYAAGRRPIPDVRFEALARLTGRDVARQLAELAAPPARGPGRGRLPAPGSPAHRRASRIVRALGPVQEV